MTKLLCLHQSVDLKYYLNKRFREVLVIVFMSALCWFIWKILTFKVSVRIFYIKLSMASIYYYQQINSIFTNKIALWDLHWQF